MYTELKGKLDIFTLNNNNDSPILINEASVLACNKINCFNKTSVSMTT